MPADIVHEGDGALTRVARKTTPAAALAALGIVYGDLGTSPLYTLQAVLFLSPEGGCISTERRLPSGLSVPKIPSVGFAIAGESEHDC
jgi:hypothetical protein